MAQRLACHAPERFAAFASVAAGGYAAMAVECGEQTPVSILYIHGTEDTRVPWQGLGVEDADGNRQLVAMPVIDSLEFWTRRNHCGPQVKAEALPRQGGSPGTSVQFLTATDCEAVPRSACTPLPGAATTGPAARASYHRRPRAG